MDDPIKEIVGAWFVAVGTIIAAIGSTPLKMLSSDLREDLNVWGNVLQVTGNVLEADGQGEISLEMIGNEIQSIGNVTVITGLVIDFEDKTQKELVITGNWLQALGGATAIGGEIEDTSDIDESYNIVGNVLQVTRNSLQEIFGTGNSVFSKISTGILLSLMGKVTVVCKDIPLSPVKPRFETFINLSKNIYKRLLSTYHLYKLLSVQFS
ncbi:DUF6944 family repetitive protein [Bacillus cereus group sp. BfR-BA-01331]|uniref:DUF6944 family repetitive protein n=1 Tax=Bacillus cereus group sp. BfR-BA-01331 TaxID=2920307 RepID=UPI001F593DB7|nr:hypothetical protein [Bacillus cereus group sp. BfR-BA-01331]